MPCHAAWAIASVRPALSSQALEARGRCGTGRYRAPLPRRSSCPICSCSFVRLTEDRGRGEERGSEVETPR